MRRAVPLAVGVLLAVFAWACHDAPSPWEPSSEETVPGARRLTFSPGDDRSPAWSAAGDSIFYVTEGYGDLARSSGVLVSIPREGGSAQSAFPILQPGRASAPPVLTPAVDPGSGRIVYAQLLQIEGVCSADATSCDATDSASAPPRLQIGRLRVRAPGAPTPGDQDPTLPLSFDGVSFDNSRHPFSLPGVWVTSLYPFQRRFNDEGLLPVRPSWDPAGDRVVTSDGLGLWLWRPDEASATPIPGTNDASSPAWSPDGGSIAFMRFERGPEFRTTCQRIANGTNGPGVACVEERTEWLPGRTLVSVIPVAGGVAVDLVEGTDPGWSPDGEWIYYARPDGIWRVRPDGGVLERVVGTAGGSEPAPSPDGAELAFTRRGEDGKGDIWVVPLP